MKNIAIILASGSGSRFDSKIPKQFVKLAGKPVIQYAIEAFEKCNSIDEIIVVCKNEYIDFVYELVNKNLFKKVNKVISGGKERYDSTLAALAAISEEECNLIVHDAVRPFISEKIILDCISELERSNAVDVVVDAVDTIVEVRDGIVHKIPDRRYLKRGQTPQAFKKSVLAEAYKRFMQDKYQVASDDCGIVLKYLPEEEVTVVQGEEANFKITHQQDIYLADNLIKDGLIGRLSHGNIEIKAALQNKVIVIFGASSGIGKDIFDLAKDYGAKAVGYSRRLTGTDISKKEDIVKALKETENLYGKIDYIVNTSGLLNRKPLVTMTDQEILDSCNINYFSVIGLARASFEYLERSKGMLINFSSSSYTRGRANYSIYSSTKAAVVNFTQALAEEWLSHDIKVNVVSPERTATPMRFENFGLEPADTLLSSKEVAQFTLSAMSFEHTGQVYSIRNLL